mmetsp:Transcript_15640/g.17355  ORF Transcript_15640/g.17355 Transcript_15640/m.17355 type:complete len:242 (+) Transcript_15640:167-892(+)
MIIATEPSTDENNESSRGTPKALQDELRALRQINKVKSTVWSNKPAKSISIVDWQQQQRALKEKERESRNKSRRLMESYQAQESAHFDYNQKELTKEATEEDKDALKEAKEKREMDTIIESHGADVQNDTDETAAIDNEDQIEGEMTEEIITLEETEAEVFAPITPVAEKLKETGEEIVSTPTSPVSSTNSSKSVIISVSKEKKKKSKSKKNSEDQSVSTTQEMVDYHEHANETLCGCIIL